MALGAIGLSVVLAWITLLLFCISGTYTSYAADENLSCRQLVTAMILAPFNLHVLYLGVIYSRGMAASDGCRHTCGLRGRYQLTFQSVFLTHGNEGVGFSYERLAQHPHIFH